MKYYFCYLMDEDKCHSISVIRSEMLEQGVKEVEIIEAKIVTGTGYFYCMEFEEVGEVGQGCGRECKRYLPRNGKNGRCRHSSNPYQKTDKRFKLKL